MSFRDHDVKYALSKDKNVDVNFDVNIFSSLASHDVATPRTKIFGVGLSKWRKI